MQEHWVKRKMIKLREKLQNFLTGTKFQKMDTKTIPQSEMLRVQKDKETSQTVSPPQHHRRLFRDRSNSFEPDIFESKRIKVTVIGDSGVGKSCIISRFLNNQFSVQHTKTVEELYRGVYEIKNERLVIDILDTSGAYSFPAMRKLAIESSDAFILVYSVDKMSSFDILKEIREEILETRLGRISPIVIVANKTDILETDQIIDNEAVKSSIVLEWENGYVETTALENVNITKVFEEVLLQCKFEYALKEAVDKKQLLAQQKLKHSELKKYKKRSCVIS